LLLAWLFAGPAWAQVSGSVTVMSNDRYDGISLSDDSPTAQLAIAWQRADGWYGGAAFTRVRFAYPGAENELQVEPYVGYVHALRPGRSIEAGAQYTWFSHSRRYGYPQLYAAWSSERIRARLAWVPGYFGQATAWYAQFDGTRPLHEPIYLIAHAGVLVQTSTDEEYASRGSDRWRYDVAAGIGATHRNLGVQLTWTTASAITRAACAPWQCGTRNAWVLTLSRSW
jgi:uncharacterized protein (TIGR02001 family)